MNSNLTLCVGILFRQISSFECLMSRIIGTTIIFVSMFSILFNCRYLYLSFYHRQFRSSHYSLIISMIISSISVIVVTTPSVLIQCLHCYRWCSLFYCRFEGFVNYLNGCVNMFMLMMISIIRYTVVLQTNIKKRSFKKHSHLAVLICWLFGLVFAVPPLFNLNKYTPEGIGFHCGLNWFDRSLSSRLYFIFTFSFVYFIPLSILFIVNGYVYCIIRRLLYGEVTIIKSDILLSLSEPKQPSTSLSSDTTTHSGKPVFFKPINLLNGTSRLVIDQVADTFQMNELLRLNRLKADRRFALATIFLVSEYLLSWTPYAFVALFYLFNINFISQHSSSMTICAFIAKISMILNPFMYIATIKPNQLKLILCCEKCSCADRRVRRNIVTL